MKYLIAMLMLSSPLLALSADANPDESFYKHAAEGGMAEVEAGKLAQDKGGAAVKDFGAMMVKDHTEANEKLQSLAASKGIKLPTSPSIMQMASAEKLKVLSGDSFDKAYIKDQIKGHKGMLALLNKEISSGQDAEAKSFATATVPTVKTHLTKINQIATDAGVDKK